MISVPTVAWRKILSDGIPIVKVCCPACGHWGDLTDHQIAADGTVSPSVICGNDGIGATIAVVPGGLRVEPSSGTACTFHDFIRLEGW